MAYKCVHCEKIYNDGSEEILKGCSNGECHSKFFFYIRGEKLKEMQEKKEENPKLSISEKKQVEQDVRDILGEEDEETPVFLDFESIKVMKPGKYLLDVARLFERGRPQIYQIEDGKYVVDLGSYKLKVD
tara:strand:- start:228 stop:617 length:390 start_codon:yes stop_codon:yes gene_type:complete